MASEDHGNLLRLEPRRGAEFYEMAAVPKNGLTQYGALPVKVPGGEMRATLGYRRYIDCDPSDTPGQDFAVARGDQQHLVGVLTDGVGQSFYGNLAAEYVSSWLLAELWTRRSQTPGDRELEAGLKQAESDFSHVVESVSLDHLPDWHRSALEATRRGGSQSVFAAFIWDFSQRRGCLYQVGDAVAMVCHVDRCEKIEAAPRGRWSSAGKSQLLLRRTPLFDTTAILLKSDGVDPGWGYEIQRQTANIAEFRAMADRRAENDDVSFVAGCLVTVPRLALDEPASHESRTLSRGSPVSIDAAGEPLRTKPHSDAGPSAASARPAGLELPRVDRSLQSPRLTALGAVGGIFLSGVAAGFAWSRFREALREQGRSVQPSEPAAATVSRAPEAARLQPWLECPDEDAASFDNEDMQVPVAAEGK